MVSFGKEANIRTQNGTLLPLACTSVELHTLRVLPFLCNFGPRALPVERLKEGLHMEVEGARDGHFGWATMQPKAEPWYIGTGHCDTTTSRN